MKEPRSSYIRWGVPMLVVLGLLGVFLILRSREPSPSDREVAASSNARQRLLAALSGARSVSVVEFTARDGLVFQRVTPSHEQMGRLRSVIEIVVSKENDFIAGCFQPHHRVEVICQDGSTFVFSVCFGCDNYCIDRKNILPIPTVWQPGLRQFFTDLGVPPRTYEEYQRLAEEKVKG